MTIDKPIVFNAAELPDWTTEALRERFIVFELPKTQSTPRCEHD